MNADEPFDGEATIELITAGAVTTLTLLVGFGLLFAGVRFFWIAYVVGFAGVLPLAVGYARAYRLRAHRANTDTKTRENTEPLEELRERYARGELTDEEFDRRVERLLATAATENAGWNGGRGRGERRTPDEDREREGGVKTGSYHP
ncbi:SHOCT domain-containing protein [Natrialba swarupiae]|uniref:SHOCT domain-containing protein n=1 Tax=Natrialba swarupiae TaxID=2448032 RepID=A0A5D5AQ61_9EURY|nr:SHOCT domain-containing protein [Natrialba swarupiae]TYT63107.1 SHOCT domain-containing protein [Natrialba swarupiae]